MMWRFCQLDRRQRIELRNRTENLSELLDWRSLNKSYSNARILALERFYGNGGPSSSPMSPSSASLVERLSGVTIRLPGDKEKEKVVKEKDTDKKERTK